MQGYDIVKLKCSIAIGMLRHRATAYSVMYDGRCLHRRVSVHRKRTSP